MASVPLVGLIGVGRAPKVHQLTKQGYEKELRRLQAELVDLEEWVRYRGLRVVEKNHNMMGFGLGPPPTGRGKLVA